MHSNIAFKPVVETYTSADACVGYADNMDRTGLSAMQHQASHIIESLASATAYKALSVMWTHTAAHMVITVDCAGV